MADKFTYASWGTSASYEDDLARNRMLYQQAVKGATSQATFDTAYEDHLIRLLHAEEQWSGHQNGAAEALKRVGSQYARGTKSGCS